MQETFWTKESGVRLSTVICTQDIQRFFQMFPDSSFQALHKTGKWSGQMSFEAAGECFQTHVHWCCSLASNLGGAGWICYGNVPWPFSSSSSSSWSCSWSTRVSWHFLGPFQAEYVTTDKGLNSNHLQKITRDVRLELKSHDFHSDLVSKEKFTTQPWAAKLRDGPGLMALGAQTAGGLRFYFSQHRKSWENEGVTSGKREMGNLWKWKEDKEKVMAQIQKSESPKLDPDMFHFETWWNSKHFSTFHQPHLFGLTSYYSHQIFSTHTK